MTCRYAKGAGGPWFLVSYVCPACGHAWDEEWSCACDSECPQCGTRNIEASEWDDAPRHAPLASLATEYQRWCEAEGIPCIDAAEAVLDDALEIGQRKWIAAFLARWDAAAATEEPQ